MSIQQEKSRMFAQLSCILIIFLALLDSNLADIYLHNPRGSNNRHNEQTRERARDTLSFDSQNNDRGGYNVGDDGTMYYYTGSILPIQWTNQHSCNDVNADCTLILQYTCNDNLRDGKSTDIIPVTEQGETNDTFRLTEDLSSYLYCRVRSRNTNLFTADQNLRGNSAIYTRQNPAGTRYGFECPEERDYYPYWQPTNWMDIAIFTNRKDLCDYYRQNSQNTKSRFACSFDTKAALIKANLSGVILPTTKEACESFDYNRFNVSKPRWREFPSHNQPPPECYTPAYTRENHLGDVRGSEMPVYNWTLPSVAAKKCLLRIRYNISTGDYDGWNTDASSNLGKMYIMKDYFPNLTVADARGYRHKNNPQIKLFDDLDFKLQLAVNTAQYGRVFEDRSFTFEIRSRPADFQNRQIYNLNVRGRRGNIVQVYPAVEYDFVPNRLEMSMNSYIHIQWIGSNTTPDGAGQGNRNIDRNNLLLLSKQVINPNWNPFEYLTSSGLLIANRPQLLNESNFLHLSRDDLKLLAASGRNTGALLENSSAYFDLGARLVSKEAQGVYHYVSTRNNDFSNRDQKGRVIVQPVQFQNILLGMNRYTVSIDEAQFKFPEGSIAEATNVKLSQLSSDQLPTIIPVNGKNIATKESLYGSIYLIEPYDLEFASKIDVEVPLGMLGNDKDAVRVLQFMPRDGVYIERSTSVTADGRRLKFQTDSGGVYAFVKAAKSPIWIAGVIISIALLIIIIISTVVYFRLSPTRYSRVKEQVTKTKRSFFSQI